MDPSQGAVSLVEDEKRPTRRGPCAVKVACTVPTGGMERRVNDTALRPYPLRRYCTSARRAGYLRRRSARSRCAACMRTQPLRETGNGSGFPAKYAFKFERMIAVA